MSERSPSPISKIEKKSSIKRSAKLEAPHSKGKQLSTSKDAKETHLPTETHKDSSFGKVVSVQSQVKSSKREIMKAKADSALKNRMEEAQKSEENRAFLNSDKISTTIKENHNKLDSNIRQHSFSPEEEGATMEVSVKKVTTESKKSKIVESHVKQSKTEIKADEKVTTQPEIITKDTQSKKKNEEVKENKFEVENSPLFRLNNEGRKPHLLDSKKVEKQKHDAETSLEKTHGEEKSKGVSKSTKRSKEGHSQLKHGAKRGKDFNDGKSLDGKSGLKKLRKQ